MRIAIDIDFLDEESPTDDEAEDIRASIALLIHRERSIGVGILPEGTDLQINEVMVNVDRL